MDEQEEDEVAPVTESVSPPPVGTSEAKLVVIRGITPNQEYKLWEGDNVIGRTDEKPVDIDIGDQESPDQMWASRQHALFRLSGDSCTVEDLGSGNGTFVNRGERLQVGQPVTLNNGDIIQVGTVHLKYVC
jgi:pSer/pThr/pTyr-binding forkhead associated (FHA) protein